MQAEVTLKFCLDDSFWWRIIRGPDSSKERVRRGGGGAITLEPTPSSHEFWRRRGFTSSGRQLAKKLRVGEDAEVSKGNFVNQGKRFVYVICKATLCIHQFLVVSLRISGFCSHGHLLGLTPLSLATFYNRDVLRQNPFAPQTLYTRGPFAPDAF